MILTCVHLLLGAILIKGFDVSDGAGFQSVIQQFCPDLCDEYRGTSPRRLVSGTQVCLVLALSNGS